MKIADMLLVGAQVIEEVESLKDLEVGDEEDLPPLKIKVDGKTYVLDSTARRTK